MYSFSFVFCKKTCFKNFQISFFVLGGGQRGIKGVNDRHLKHFFFPVCYLIPIIVVMNLKLFYSSVAFQHFAYGIIIPTLMVWQNELGLSFAEIGIIQTVGILTVLISEVPSSYFADRVGRKLTLVLGFIVSILSYYFLFGAQDFFGFLVAQILLSLGMAFFSGTQESLLHDLVGYQKSMTKFLGRMSIVDESATIMGMLASSLFIGFSSIQNSFFGALIALILGFICVFFVKFNEQEEADFEPPGLKNIRFKSLNTFLIVLFFSIVVFRGEITFQASFSLTNTVLVMLGGVYTFAKIFSIIGSALAYKIEVLLGLSRSMFFTLLLQVVSFALLIAINTWITIFALAIYFFSENVFRNIRDSYILHHAPKNLRSTFISTVSLASAVLALGMTPIIGYGIDQAFYYGVLIIVGMKFIAGVFLFRRSFRQIFD